MSGAVALSSTSPVAILATMTAAPITSPGRFCPLGPLGTVAAPAHDDADSDAQCDTDCEVVHRDTKRDAYTDSNGDV